MSQGCSYPPPAATVGRAGLAPHVSGTIELTLLAEAWLSKEELSLLPISHVVAWVGARCPPLFCPSMLDLEVMREGALALLLLCCSTQESGQVAPIPSLGNTIELAMRTGKQEKKPCPWLIAAGTMQESSPQW